MTFENWLNWKRVRKKLQRLFQKITESQLTAFGKDKYTRDNLLEKMKVAVVKFSLVN